MPALQPESQLAPKPNRVVMLVAPGASLFTNAVLAQRALERARAGMPKVTGHLASTLQPVYGEGFFGLYFPDRITYFLERGTQPFTMKNLAGKTVPMWIDDPTGAERRANPKAKRRVTRDGRTQILIFRKAASKGAKKTVYRTERGVLRAVQVPRSYPGAPGRIVRREAKAPATTPGKVGGQIAARNVGVRWRHPGIGAREFLNMAVTTVALDVGLDLGVLYLVDDPTFYQLVGG